MSKKNICLTFLCLSVSLFGYGQLTLNGANMTLSGATLVYSKGDIIINNTSIDTSQVEISDDAGFFTDATIQNSGIIHNKGSIEVVSYTSVSEASRVLNEGEIDVSSDFNIERGVYSGLGGASVSFIDGGDHFVKAIDENQIRLLVVEEGDVVMESDFVVENVRFNNGKIICNGNRLGVSNNMSGFDARSYVVGQLARIVELGDYVMPIGTLNKYRPATITDVTDSTIVFMEVYTSSKELEEFGDLREVDEAIIWEYSTNSAVVSNLPAPYKVGLSYEPGDFSEIGTNTASHRVAISDIAEEGYYDYGGASGMAGQNRLTTLYATDDIPASGLISIGEICSLNEFTVSAFLEGPYNTTTGLMNNDIVLELKDEFEFGGNATTQMREGFTVPTEAVDLVRVVLRDKATLNRMDTAFAWLMRDGSTKDFETGLQTKIGYCDVASLEFYLQVEHKNHLPIMSSKAYENSPSVTSVNLKDMSEVYGVGYNTSYNSATMNNEVLMYAGDNVKSASNVVNALDYIKVVNALYTLPTGYLKTDLNLSGEVDSGDNDLGLDNSSQLRKSTVR